MRQLDLPSLLIKGTLSTMVITGSLLIIAVCYGEVCMGRCVEGGVCGEVCMGRCVEGGV